MDKRTDNISKTFQRSFHTGKLYSVDVEEQGVLGHRDLTEFTNEIG